MMVTFYYRSDDAAVIAAKKQDFEESLALEVRARAFADLFGAIPVFTKGLAPHFAGVTFNKQHGKVPQSWKLWTAPQNGAWVMWLYPPKAVSEKLRKASIHWNTVWNDNIEAVKADMQPRSSHLLAAIGLNEEVIQGNAMDYFFVPEDGVSWVASTMPLDESKFTEVLASEFDKARDSQQRKAAIAQAEQQAAAAAAAGVPTLTSIPYEEPAA